MILFVSVGGGEFSFKKANLKVRSPFYRFLPRPFLPFANFTSLYAVFYLLYVLVTQTSRIHASWNQNRLRPSLVMLCSSGTSLPTTRSTNLLFMASSTLLRPPWSPTLSTSARSRNAKRNPFRGSCPLRHPQQAPFFETPCKCKAHLTVSERSARTPYLEANNLDLLKSGRPADQEGALMAEFTIYI